MQRRCCPSKMAVLGEDSKVTKLPKIHGFSPIPDNKLISISLKNCICVLDLGQPYPELPNRKRLATNDNSTPWKATREREARSSGLRFRSEERVTANSSKI